MKGGGGVKAWERDFWLGTKVEIDLAEEQHSVVARSLVVSNIVTKIKVIAPSSVPLAKQLINGF